MIRERLPTPTNLRDTMWGNLAVHLGIAAFAAQNEGEAWNVYVQACYLTARCYASLGVSAGKISWVNAFSRIGLGETLKCEWAPLPDGRINAGAKFWGHSNRCVCRTFTRPLRGDPLHTGETSQSRHLGGHACVPNDRWLKPSRPCPREGLSSQRNSSTNGCSCATSAQSLWVRRDA